MPIFFTNLPKQFKCDNIDTNCFMCAAASIFYLYYNNWQYNDTYTNSKTLTLLIRQVIISSDWPSADKLTMKSWGLGPIQFEGTWYIYLDVYMDSVNFLSKKDWLFTVIGRKRDGEIESDTISESAIYKGYSCREWRNEIKLPVYWQIKINYNFCDLGVIFIFKITCSKFIRA